MSIYAIAMAAHILGAVALLVGLVLIVLSLWRMSRAVSLRAFQRWAGLAAKADKLLPVGAALILLSGLYMTITVWGWSHGWVNTALAALLLVSPLAPTVIAPRLAAICKGVGGIPDEPVHSALQTATHDPALRVSVSVMMAVSLGIAVLMLAKPATFGSIMIVAVALLVGLAVAFPAWRRKRLGPVRG